MAKKAALDAYNAIHDHYPKATRERNVFTDPHEVADEAYDQMRERHERQLNEAKQLLRKQHQDETAQKQAQVDFVALLAKHEREQRLVIEELSRTSPWTVHSRLMAKLATMNRPLWETRWEYAEPGAEKVSAIVRAKVGAQMRKERRLEKKAALEQQQRNVKGKRNGP